MRLKKLLIWTLRTLSPVYGRERFARFLGVKIGKRCRVYITSWGSEPFLIEIGDNVTLTSGVVLLTHDGSTCLVCENGNRFQYYAPVSIGNNVFIGINSIVMPGVKICNDVVIGAGSIVTKSIIEPGVYVGNPARKFSDFESFEMKIKQTCHTDAIFSGQVSYKERVLQHVYLGKKSAE